MKKMIKYVQVVASVALFVTLITISSFASAQMNVVSPDEAADLALFYYCVNSAEEESLTFDEYTVTPLYDENGNITYYAVDFFFEKKAKGYVTVGGNLNYFLCSELSFEGSSVYYQNALQSKEMIYYNPFEIYVVDEAEEELVYRDLSEQDLESEDVSGTIYGGELIENRAILQATSNTTDPLEDRRVLTVHPLTYLVSLGYTGVSTKSYSTFETAMDNAGAFNYMYPSSSIPKTLPDGTVLRNSGHCGITAISNVLKYWRSVCCPNYPSTYDEIFEVVLNYATASGWFSNTSGGGFNRVYYDDVLLGVNSSHSYSGRTYVNTTCSTSFLKTYINAEWPIILSLITTVSEDQAANGDTWPYSTPHATVAFGYNVMEASYEDNYCEYTFVKIFDAHRATGKVYVSWDMLTSSDYYATKAGYTPITTRMVAFCPY